jgi:hypothetical protein
VRQGDSIPVLVEAADGPVIVMHTPEEYARIFKGLAEDLEETDDDND